MKKLSILIFLLITFGINITQGQVITVDPPFPTAADSVIVTLNTTGTGLDGYTGDVYAHTGITVNGTNWQYVVGAWGDNTTQPKLTNIGDNLYQLEITPTIRDFYGAAPNDSISELSFVFRSADGSQQTSPDIFYNVANEPGLGLILTSPEILINAVLVNLNDTIPVRWTTNLADSSFLYIDDQLVLADTGSSFAYDIYATETGKKWITIDASNETDTLTRSFYYYTRGEVVEEALPDGIRDGINYIDDSTVILCLYAPEKEFVYVLGDFSNWELSDDMYMKKTPDKDRFWLKITNLEPKKQYIFQYFIDGDPTILVGDMYCEQVSDPWNDRYISPETYPDLPPYPDGKTVFLASVLQTAQDKYQWQDNDFEAPKVTDLVIYELLVRDFLQTHDFNTLTDTLDYLDRLGVNAIELMPVNEFGGNSSWGYNPNYYFAVDKYYGPRNTLKAFIDECHSRGIAVILDLVLNHSYDSPFVQMYYDKVNNRPAANNPWYNEESNFPFADANWGNDFNHESPATQALVDSINSYWMSEYHVDGYRFDFTKGFSNTIHGQDDPWGSKYDAARVAILKRMADEIWKRKENAYIIFEHLAENSEEKVLANYGILLWGNMNYSYNEGTMGYNDGGKSDFSWISYQKRGWNDPHVVGYAESHDEERLMFKNETYGNLSGNYSVKDTTIALQRQALAANFFYTIPGPKMIWQFGERGYDYSINFNPGNPDDDCRLCEKPPRWDYMNDWRRRTLYYVNEALIKLRTEQDIFETTDFELKTIAPVKEIRLWSDNMSMIILGNFNVTEDEIDPDFYHTGSWYDFWTGDSLEVTNVNEVISLKPGEYRLYTDKKLNTPDFVGIDENKIEGPVNDFVVFPNPSSDRINLGFEMVEMTEIQIMVFDLQGRMVREEKNHLNKGIQTLGLNISNLDPGLYFITVQDGTHSLTKKLMVN